MQQDLGITLSTSVGMIGVLEIMLIVPALWTAPRKLDSLMIVPTLCVVTPLRTLRVRSRMWRRAS